MLERQTSSTSISPKINKELTDKYGSAATFVQTFYPPAQLKLCPNRELCFFGDFPTLYTLKNGYRGRVDIAWLIPQLTDLSEFCGCKGKLTDSQIEQTAHIIASTYGYLKVSELMLFFYGFKEGKYGHFYGNVDPILITSTLRDFIVERSDAIDKRDHELAAKKIIEDAKNAVTYEEYCKQVGKSPLNGLPLSLPTTQSLSCIKAIQRLKYTNMRISLKITYTTSQKKRLIL